MQDSGGDNYNNLCIQYIPFTDIYTEEEEEEEEDARE